MKYTKYDMDGYKVHIINTDKFKTISLRIDIRIKDYKKAGIYLSLLSSMLLTTNSKYDSMKQLNKACASIYDPAYTIKCIDSGSEIITELSAKFPNEKYTEEGMNEKTIKFLLDILFKPKIVNDAFDEEMFEIRKKTLIEHYKSLKDNPKEYASNKLKENMQIKQYKDYSIEQYIEKTNKLTAKQLYKFYLKIINEGCLDIFIVGSVDNDKIKEIFNKYVFFKGVRKEKINHRIKQKSYNKKINTIISSSDNVQSSLAIGCKIIDATDYEINYTSLVYSWILGNGTSSLLYQSVREENSLCYYIYSSRSSLLGTMQIYAGINAKDYEKTLELIKKSMEDMKNGNFTNQQLESVKNTYYNSLISIEDYQSDLISSKISEVFIGIDSIDKRRENMEKLSREDIINYAKKVHMDTIFFLKGEKNDKKI